MSNIFWKNFHLCFSKLKCSPPSLSPPPKQDHSHPSHIPSTTSIMIKNFNSFYDLNSNSNSNSTSKSHTPSTDEFFSSSDDSDSETPPDFATIFASQRLFFSSPGRSNSIIESPDSRPESDTLVGGGVAIPKYSPDPYMDFRRSMQEMVEAREFRDARDNWEYLHELLLCYLTLNPQHTHKFIISAFTDLVICLMSSSRTVDCHRETECRRGSAVSRRLL